MFATRVADWSPTGSFTNSAYWSTSATQDYFLQVPDTSTTYPLINICDKTVGFTIEYWVYASGFSSTTLPYFNCGPGNYYPSGTSIGWSFGLAPNGGALQLQLDFYNQLSQKCRIRTDVSTNPLSYNTWYNVCLVSTPPDPGNPTQPSYITVYINGVVVPTALTVVSGSGPFQDTNVLSGDNDVLYSTSYSFGIGSIYDSSASTQRYWKDVYFDNIRVSNVARYSGSSYTLATNQFDSDSSTQLLMLMNSPNGSTTFVDSSSHNLPITNNSNNVVSSNTYANHT